MQWPSLDTEMSRGRSKWSGASRARRRSPVMVWTRHGPSAKAKHTKFQRNSCLSMIWKQFILFPLVDLTFGSTDDQAKFCTHGHTNNFLVMACQNSSRCWVVTFKVRHTTNQNNFSKIQVILPTGYHITSLAEVSLDCHTNAVMFTNDHQTTWFLLTCHIIDDGQGGG